MHAFHFAEAYLGILAQAQPRPTVLSLCRSLGLQRSAFYRSYSGIDDLDQRFLPVLYSRKVGALAVAQRSCADLVCYFVGIARVMSHYPDFFGRMFDDRGYLGYRETWVALVRADVTARWPHTDPRRLVAPDHHSRFRYSVALIPEYLDMAVHAGEDQWRPLAYALIQFMAGGRLRVLGKCKNLAAVEDPELNQWLEVEVPPGRSPETIVSAAM